MYSWLMAQLKLQLVGFDAILLVEGRELAYLKLLDVDAFLSATPPGALHSKLKSIWESETGGAKIVSLCQDVVTSFSAAPPGARIRKPRYMLKINLKVVSGTATTDILTRTHFWRCWVFGGLSVFLAAPPDA